MQEFSSVSASSYDPSSLAAKLTEKSAEGWSVVSIVPTGSDVTAFLTREATATSSAGAEPAADAGATGGWSAGTAAASGDDAAAATPATAWSTGDTAGDTADTAVSAADTGYTGGSSDTPSDTSYAGSGVGDAAAAAGGYGQTASDMASGAADTAQSYTDAAQGAFGEAAGGAVSGYGDAGAAASGMAAEAGDAAAGAAEQGAASAASGGLSYLTPEPANTTPAASEPAGWGAAPETSMPTLNAELGGGIPTLGSSADVTAAAQQAQQPTIAQQAQPAQQPPVSAVPAGWYADPAARFELRYWDGNTWTEHVSRAGQQSTDPPVA